MKVRMGFVANSSSSSFVVAFAKRPRTVKQMQKMLFGEDESYPNPYHYDDDPVKWTAEEVARTVHGGLKGQKPLSVEKVAEEIGSGYFLQEYDPEIKALWDKMNRTRFSKADDGRSWREAWNEYQAAEDRVAKRVAKEFVEKHPECKCFRFSYSDNDGAYYAALEHGNLFRRMPHLRVNHH